MVKVIVRKNFGMFNELLWHNKGFWRFLTKKVLSMLFLGRFMHDFKNFLTKKL